MKEDFENVKSQVDIQDLATLLLGQPIRQMYRYPGEKTASIKVYPKTQSFFDFGRNCGGDCIKLWSHVHQCDSWTALKALCSLYGISDEPGRGNIKECIRQQKQERKKAVRQQEFRRALYGKINRLKDWRNKYKNVLEKGEIEPFSDLWTYVIGEAQKTEYKLDILTEADMGTYRRLKPNLSLGLSSDRPAWLLGVLDILEESGVFHATESEIAEIKTQYQFEMCKRKPGTDRRCSVEW